MLGKLKLLVPRNAFTRSVMTLSGGTVFAQILMLAAAPLLTRLYSPADFGIYAVYIGIIAMLSVVSSGGYKWALPLPKSDREASLLLVLSIALVLGTVILTGAASYFVSYTLGDMRSMSAIAPYLWLLPVGVFGAAMYEVLYYWAVRCKEFSALASARIQQSTIVVVVQVLLAKIGPLGIIIGHVIGSWVGAFRLYVVARRTVAAGVAYPVSALRDVAVRYDRFPKYTVWADFSNQVGWQLPPLLFAALFSPAAAGLYALTHRVLSMPMMLVGGAVSSVFFADAAGAHREGRLAGVLSSVTRHLAHIGIPFAFAIAISGPTLFAFVFGERWEEAGLFARWMAMWLGIAFVVSPLSTLYEVLGKQKQALYFQISVLAMRLLAISVGVAYGSALTAIIMLSFGHLIAYTGLGLWLFRLVGESPISLVTPLVSSSLWGMLLASPLLLGLSLWKDDVLLLGICATVTLIGLGIRYTTLLKAAYR